MATMNLFEAIKFGSLIGKYITGKESDTESDQLIAWLEEDEKHQKFFKKLNDEKEIASAIDELEHFNKKRAWKRSMEQLTTIHLKKALSRWKAAAVFFLLIGCAGLLATIIKNHETHSPTGETYTTVSTRNGQSSRILLPDSSVVWINSGSSLTYNNNFAISNRDVSLNGQAYFQVAENEKIPLTVAGNDLKVMVWGTEFDMSAYPEDREISVVLESGSVELLHVNDKSFTYKMKPGEKAAFNHKRRELSVSNVDTYKFTSWKDGVLIFKDDPMNEVFEKLARWYNVDIEVKNEKIGQLVFNATIVNESVEEIFDLIKFTCGINYEIISSDKPEVPVKIIVSSI